LTPLNRLVDGGPAGRRGTSTASAAGGSPDRAAKQVTRNLPPTTGAGFGARVQIRPGGQHFLGDFSRGATRHARYSRRGKHTRPQDPGRSWVSADYQKFALTPVDQTRTCPGHARRTAGARNYHRCYIRQWTRVLPLWAAGNTAPRKNGLYNRDRRRQQSSEPSGFAADLGDGAGSTCRDIFGTRDKRAGPFRAYLPTIPGSIS